MLLPQDFLGSWLVERAIDDHRAGQKGRFEGAATFSPEGEAMRYREEGTLRLGAGPALRASRENRWRWRGGEVEVLFADGRPFHRFVPWGQGAGTDHPCGADLYRVRYDFAAWPSWSTEWAVGGPAKDYRMRTAYRRG